MQKIGVDITQISRFENMNENTYQKFLHPDEIIEYKKSVNKSTFLAKRWSIKEALFKADNNLSIFSKIKILKKDRKYFYKGFSISTSSENDYCVSFVIGELNETKK